MAKVVITIEDQMDGTVRVTSEPSMEQMFKMEISGETLKSSHGYAFAALNKIREQSKSNDPTNIIKIPKIYRP